MKFSARSFFTAVLLSFLNLLQFSQGQTYIPANPWKIDTLIVVTEPNYRYQIPERHRIQWHTMQISRNRLPLRLDQDYRIIDQRFFDFFSALSLKDSLHIWYSREPSNFRKKYVLFERDTLGQANRLDSSNTARAEVRLQRLQLENPFSDLQSGLKTSGSIMRGVQIGSNRDLTLNSGLNIELSGQLSENLEVVAALTDEATPIQPEGNTQTLEEVDKVFVSFKSPYVQGTVGDFNLKYENTEFGMLSRKLQGITLLGEYKNNYLGGTIATTRGFFNRVQFIGQEGNQGPYLLTGNEGEREIIVLAGTERIWINGELMVRGESNDYIIEYGNGQIIFTNRRLITSESRIEIDFEYFPATQKYNRNVYSGNIGSVLAKDKFWFKMHYYREADNPDQVFEAGGAFSEEEKQILENAGDDYTKAYRPGESYAGPNQGSYTKADTLIDSQSLEYFKYRGRDGGDYNVTFSFVKEGDYVRDRLGVYRFVGTGKGSYLPRRFIPLPSAHNLADFQAEWQPKNHYKMNAEYAFTQLDRNSLSGLDDADNQGHALKVKAELIDLPLDFNLIHLGKINVNLHTKFIDKKFQAVDRLNQPDYQRYWNVLQNAQNQNEEWSWQMNSVYQPIGSLDLTLNAGYLDKTDFQSQRYAGSFRFDRPDIARASAKYEYVGSDISNLDIKNDWWRYSGQLQKAWWKLSPELLYAGELRKNLAVDRLTGFKFDDMGLRLGLIRLNHLGGFYQFNRRQDFVYEYQEKGRLLPQATTQTHQFSFDLQNFSETSANLRFIRRNKDFSSTFEEIRIDTLRLLYVDASVQDTVWQDRTTNLAELNIDHNQWKKALNITLQYKISTEQVALKEKVYINVGEDRGNLRFDEDLQEYIPDPNGNYILFILPSGRLEPVTNLESALRIKFDPAKYWRNDKHGLKNWLSNVSGESYFRVEEETKESDIRSIYLLNLSKFQKEQTLRGNLTFNQDLYLLRNNRTLSFRLRYRYSDGRFNQYLDPNENEDRLSRESGIRTDWRISTQLKSQTEFRQRYLMRESKASPLRNRDISGFYYDQKFSYRPVNDWELGLESEFGSEKNQADNYPLDLWYEALKGRISYSLPAKGRAHAEYVFQTVETTKNPLGLVVPFEMARGKKEGNTQLWELRVEYTIAKNILFTFYYNGRDEANFKKVIHSGQAEIRAYF